MITKKRNNMLEAYNISLSFDKPVLKNISFKVKKGQVMGLVGKSGAGKSSLLNILAGHLAPNEGEVHIDNKKLDYLYFFLKLYLNQNPLMFHFLLKS